MKLISNLKLKREICLATRYEFWPYHRWSYLRLGAILSHKLYENRSGIFKLLPDYTIVATKESIIEVHVSAITCFYEKKEAQTMALLVFLCQRRDFVSFVSTLSLLLLLFFFFLLFCFCSILFRLCIVSGQCIIDISFSIYRHFLVLNSIPLLLDLLIRLLFVKLLFPH